MSLELSIRRVSRRYRSGTGDVAALAEISLEVAEREFVMLVGPSGCGKSTLLNIVAGLEKPDSGEVLLDGKPVTGPGRERSLVFQDGALFPWLTVRKNVEFGLRQLAIGAKERQERACSYIERVGLADFADNWIHELSGGMRQRVALARALAVEPEVLLMDEPFSALDAMTREDLYDQLQAIWHDRSTTVLFVTHNVREAVTLGDRVILLSGRPARILEDVRIDIARPRRIDDAEVAHTAQEISLALKGHGQGVEDGKVNDALEAGSVFRPADSGLGSPG